MVLLCRILSLKAVPTFLRVGTAFRDSIGIHNINTFIYQGKFRGNLQLKGALKLRHISTKISINSVHFIIQLK